MKRKRHVSLTGSRIRTVPALFFLFGIFLSLNNQLSGQPPTIITAQKVVEIGNDEETALFSGVLIRSELEGDSNLQLELKFTDNLPGVISTPTGMIPAEKLGHLEVSGNAKEINNYLDLLIFTPANDPEPKGERLRFSVLIVLTETLSKVPVEEVIYFDLLYRNTLPELKGILTNLEATPAEIVYPFLDLAIIDDDSVNSRFRARLTQTPVDSGVLYARNRGGRIETKTIAEEGTIQELTEAIAGWGFISSVNRLPLDTVEETELRLAVTDSLGRTSEHTVKIQSTSVNTAPRIEGIGPIAIPDNAIATPFTSLVIKDPAAGDGDFVFLTLRIPEAIHPQFEFPSAFSAVPGHEYLFAGDPQAATELLKQVRFTPIPNRPRNDAAPTIDISLTVRDRLGASNRATQSITVFPVNDSPQFRNPSANPIISENRDFDLFSEASVFEPDPSDDFVVLRLELESLDLGNFKTPPDVFQKSPGVIAISGSPAKVTETLRKIQFAPIPLENIDSATAISIRYLISDRLGGQAEGTASRVQLLPDLNQPKVSIPVHRFTIPDNASFQSVIEGGTISSSHGDNQRMTLRFSVDQPGLGFWRNGAQQLSFGDQTTVSINGNAAFLTEWINQLEFKPAANIMAPGTTHVLTTTFELQDHLDNQSTESMLRIEVVSLNDPPFIAPLRIHEVDDTESFQPLANLTLLDPDAHAAPHKLAIRILHPSRFSVERLNGFTVKTIGLMEIEASLIEIPRLAEGLTLKPKPNLQWEPNGSQAGFEITLYDPAGASHRVSSAVLIDPVNDLPQLIGLFGTQIVTDETFIHPFEGVEVVDPDAESTALTIKLDFSDLHGGTLNNVSGFQERSPLSLTFSGSADKATSVLQALSYRPVENQQPVNQTTKTLLHIAVQEAGQKETLEQQIELITLSLNDPPTIQGRPPLTLEGPLIRPFEGLEILDRDIDNQELKLEISLVEGIHGFILDAPFLEQLSDDRYQMNGKASSLTQAIQNLTFAPLPDSPKEPSDSAVSTLDPDNDGRTNQEEFLEQTSPTDRTSFLPKRLGYWSFNTSSFLSFQGDRPRDQFFAKSAEGINHSGVLIDGRILPRLAYDAYSLEGERRISANHGSVRFWFQPNWDSGEGPGFGPGNWASLIEVGHWTESASDGWWSLGFNKSGNRIQLDTQADHQSETPLSFPIAWRKGEWHEIILNYRRDSTSLYLDGEKVVEGNGLRLFPSQEILRQYGFNIGSDRFGQFQAKGVFDELETFNYQLGQEAEQREHPWAAATAIPSPLSLSLTSKNLAGAARSILKREAGSLPWQEIASDFKAWTYIDQDIAPGKIYEYRVGGSRIYAGLGVQPIEKRGVAILAIDETLADKLEPELSRLESDLISDGWRVERVMAPRHDDHSAIPNPPRYRALKAEIRSIYQRSPLDLHSLIIIGHVVIPKTGLLNPDGHFKRPFPCDGYYADAVESHPWRDSKTLRGNQVINHPGDGHFDHNIYPSPLEMSYGRVDFANMPAFEDDQNRGVPKRSEITMLRDYLNKNHDFRTGMTYYLPRVASRGSFTGFAGILNDRLSQAAQRNANWLFGASVDSTIDEDLFQTRRPILWGYQAGFGNYEFINCCGLPYTYSTVSLTDPANNPAVGIVVLDGSYFGEWDRQNVFLRAVLAQPKYTVAALWGRQAHLRFERLALGHTLGEGMLDTINDLSQFRTKPNVHLQLLGDPTLRPHVVPSPTSGRLTATEREVKLEWQPAETAPNCHVYLSTTGPSGPFIRMTNKAIPDGEIILEQAPADESAFLIRSLRLEETGGGSYWNLSSGLLITP